MTAPELSPEERAVVDRFEAAPYPTEVSFAHIGRAFSEMAQVLSDSFARSIAAWNERHR